MIENAFEQIVKPILNLLGKHSPFIFGVIINALIMVLCIGLVMTSFVSCFDDESEVVDVSGKTYNSSGSGAGKRNKTVNPEVINELGKLRIE